MTGRPKLGKILRRVLFAVLIAVFVLNWTWGKIPKEPPVPSGKFAQVDDLRIHYVEQPGAEPAVVMLHGLPGTGGDWDNVTERLPGRHTIAIDRPGFAYSNGDYVPFDEQVSTVHKLIEKLHVKRPVVAGHSYGGTLALAYAKAYPKDVRSIVLVDAADDPAGQPAFDIIQAHFVKFLQLPVIKPVADFTFSQALRTASANMGDKEAFDPNPVNPAHKQRLLELNMQSEDLKAYSGELINFGDVIDKLDPQVPSIGTPAWIIQGREDKLVSPATARRLNQRLPHSKLILVSGGHMATYVHPDVVAAQIKAASR